MQLLNQSLVIALGGAFGTVLRFWVGSAIDSASSRGGVIFPWGTIVVNISGCFVIGLSQRSPARKDAGSWRRGCGPS